MKTFLANPTILLVTPEVSYLPRGMGDIADNLSAKAGGLADVSATLISALFELGADIHVALPDYRCMFGAGIAPLQIKKLDAIRRKMPAERIHLAEDRAFFYLNRVYSNYGNENGKISLAFQREVINNIIPSVQPDLIHCNDWMTGLIPAMARQQEIPCLFTIHNIHTVKRPLAYIEDRGIDAASFWQYLFYGHYPSGYEQIRESNPVDFLVSGVFAAHFVNTVSETFLKEIVNGRHDFVKASLRRELAGKFDAQCATGIPNAPDANFDPESDKRLQFQYDADTHGVGKRENKKRLQNVLGLIENENAPLFFWPSRLDTVQKGCQLLAHILYDVVNRFWDRQLQVVFVADGPFKPYFQEINWHHNLLERVAICDFDENLSHLAYGASDFVLMPSLFEPCGLPQMIGAIYGSLPVAHDIGGIHDTVVQMDVVREKGNGFLFKTFDAEGLSWAVDQAMAFYTLPEEVKNRQITRVMREGKAAFNHSVTARSYMDLYEKMLERPLIND
ncbi:glycogen/starch synthase, ADP-glucose type [delta proteobacterium NaphS2]|nr:glycogen/starch synthase, ADP-glucose type [delta proteobacterium NaphS2]